MTLRETVEKISRELGLAVVPKNGEWIDVTNPDMWRQTLEILSPTSIKLFEIYLIRPYNFDKDRGSNEDNGWSCGSISFPFSINETQYLVEK